MLSPYTKRPIVKKQPTSILDVGGLVEKMNELDAQIQSVQTLKEQMKEEHKQALADLQKTHQKGIEKINQTLAVAEEHISKIQKGEPGEPAPKVDEKAMEERIFSKIEVPEPFVDEVKISKMASKLIKVPEPKTPVIDHSAIADKVLELIDKGKKKLSIKHIGDFTDGLEQTMRPIRSLMAGFRGGGDVVTAGSGITITTDSNGKKVITGSAGGTFIENEVVAGSGTAFTLANTPIAGSVKVFGSGQRLVLTTDYSIVGTAITTVGTWNTGDIVADYRK